MDALGKFFTAPFRAQTYLNALYLLLSFPLGLFYFVFLVVGISLGFPLVIIWVGLLILAFVFTVWYAFIVFERQMAIWLLREDIPPVNVQDMSQKNLWQKFTATVTNPVTWKGLVYLFAKFPLGVISFTLLVTFAAVSLTFLALPFYYQQIGVPVNFVLDFGFGDTILKVNTLGEALIGSLIGIIFTLISMAILNGLAWISGKFARVMLGNFSTPPVQSAAPVQPAAHVQPAAPVQPTEPAFINELDAAPEAMHVTVIETPEAASKDSDQPAG